MQKNYRYKLLKIFFGLMSLWLFIYHFPKSQQDKEDRKAENDAQEKAVLAMKKVNPSAHFFVSCGGFIS